jgi:hypothetical protein
VCPTPPSGPAGTVDLGVVFEVGVGAVGAAVVEVEDLLGVCPVLAWLSCADDRAR